MRESTGLGAKDHWSATFVFENLILSIIYERVCLGRYAQPLIFLKIVPTYPRHIGPWAAGGTSTPDNTTQPHTASYLPTFSNVRIPGHIRPCLSDSFRSESSSPGRAISYSWRAASRGCSMQGRKTAKGPKGRIEYRSHHHHGGFGFDLAGSPVFGGVHFTSGSTRCKVHIPAFGRVQFVEKWTPPPVSLSLLDECRAICYCGWLFLISEANTHELGI
jgi:hypothetical protein